MKVGELILLPNIRESEEKDVISTSGTSCNQQILDGTGIQKFYLIEILNDALIT